MAKRVSNSRAMVCDVCQASYKDLHAYFSRPGVSFGELRRKQLMEEQREKGLVRTIDTLVLQCTRRISDEMASSLYESEDAYIDAYLTSLERAKTYTESVRPHFCGGPLEKVTFRAKRDVRHCSPSYEKHGNQRQHSNRVRPKRITIRGHFEAVFAPPVF